MRSRLYEGAGARARQKAGQTDGRRIGLSPQALLLISFYPVLCPGKTRSISFACSIERLWQCCLPVEYPTPALPRRGV